ncbi:MAG: hypothetical protein K2X81_05745, partial [Candidatus Obscuribacterales bacterium]|nr:hypothetical protein [Candidatus Obscuribacterales bacterium]
MDQQTGLDQSINTRLRRSDLFSVLTEEEFNRLLQGCDQLRLALGDLLPDASTGKIKVLAAGKIRLLERFPAGDENNLCTLDITGESWSEPWLQDESKGIVLARASEPSLVFAAEQSLFSELASRNLAFAQHLQNTRQQWEWLSFLRHTEFLGKIPAGKLRAITRYLNQLSINQGDKIDESLTGIYVIIKGDIECNNVTGSKSLLAGDYFIPNDFAGLKASGETFRVAAPAQLLSINQEQYANLLNHSPDLAQLIADSIASTPSGTASIIAPPGNNFSLGMQATSVQTDYMQQEAAEDEPFVAKINSILHQYPVIMQQSQMDCGVTCLA